MSLERGNISCLNTNTRKTIPNRNDTGRKRMLADIKPGVQTPDFIAMASSARINVENKKGARLKDG